MYVLSFAEQPLNSFSAIFPHKRASLLTKAWAQGYHLLSRCGWQWYLISSQRAAEYHVSAAVLNLKAADVTLRGDAYLQTIRISPATKQMCVDLATGLGLPANLPLSIPATLPQSPGDFNGVSWDCMKGKWHVMVGCGEQVVDFGWFQDKEEAACSFDAAAVASKQEGCLNFPHQVPPAFVRPICLS